MINTIGWIKLQRELLIEPIWLNSTHKQRTVLITLLLLAEHKNTKNYFKGKIITLKQNQLITTIAELALISKTSVKTVRNTLKKFKKMEFLDYESSNKNTLITILGSLNETPKEKNNKIQLDKNNNLFNDIYENTTIELPKNNDQTLDNLYNDLVSNLSEEIEPKLIEYIIQLSNCYNVENKRNYVTTVINNCLSHNIKTKSDYLEKTKKKNQNNISSKRANPKRTFKNFTEREDIDFEEIRKLELERIDKELEEYETNKK